MSDHRDYCFMCGGFGSSLYETAERCTVCGGKGLYSVSPAHIVRRSGTFVVLDRHECEIGQSTAPFTAIEIANNYILNEDGST